MAAVTINTAYQPNIPGSLREFTYNITIATSGDTLVVPIRAIRGMYANDVAITKMTPTVSGFGSSVAFTTTGAVTGAYVTFTGV